MCTSQKDSEQGPGGDSRQWKRFGGLALVLILAVAIPVADRMKYGSVGEEYHQQLRHEFGLIQAPANAAVMSTTDDYSKWRPHQALVGATYKTTQPYSMIAQYYEEQLKRNNWTPLGEHSVTDWGRDLGGQTSEYCKGPLRASLQYKGERADYGWTFAFNVSWGLGSQTCR